MLLTFAILQWYLLSFIAIDEYNTRKNDDDIYKNYKISDPLWKTCPIKEVDDNESGMNDICFLTSIFGDSIGNVDRPADVEWFDRYWCHTRFLLVTNLKHLPSLGWTKIVINLASDVYIPVEENGDTMSQNLTAYATQKHIVQSRHAKFLAWAVLPEIVPTHCTVVIYMDGYLTPLRFSSWSSLLVALLSTPPWSPASPLFWGSAPWMTRQQIPPPLKFQTVAKQVHDHPWGLSQVKQQYFDGLSMTTLLHNLVRDRKDTKQHVEKTLRWFRSQTTDFREIMPYYLNKFFGM